MPGGHWNEVWDASEWNTEPMPGGHWNEVRDASEWD